MTPSLRFSATVTIAGQRPRRHYSGRQLAAHHASDPVVAPIDNDRDAHYSERQPKMRVLLQRVSKAEVRIREPETEPRVTGRIGRGFVLLVGFTAGDTDDHCAWMAEKVTGLRLFSDADDKMNLALSDVGGSMLVVSQFTLYGDARKGRRPSFIDAARPEVAIPLYERFVEQLRKTGIPTETGEFGAMMDVELVNDGPVTLWLER
jgi:D-tyrosyl-tRNA(Tyr) deacylase